MNKPIAWEITCINCRHIRQGDPDCYCANPKQTNEDSKKYVYWSFSCELGERKEIIYPDNK